MHLLDVTLRDGGHCCGFDFPKNLVKKYLRLMEQANLDYVEVGYRNGFLSSDTTLGQAAYCHDEYISLCREQLITTQLAVMAHPAKISSGDIKQLKALGVNLLRLCVGPSDTNHSICSIIQKTRRLELPVSINFTHASQYQLEQLVERVKYVTRFDVDWIYFADSNGSWEPGNIEQLLKHLNNQGLNIGFHPHDNLGLAQTNTITAVKNGATMIDASIQGFGKGGGNLNLEKYVAYLYATMHSKYDIHKIIDAQKIMKQYFFDESYMPEFSLQEIVRGIEDLSTFQFNEIYG